MARRRDSARSAQTKIEDYGFLSDTQAGALVSRDGSLDWLCFPRFDSGACFAALLGDKNNGRWSFTPTARVHVRRRRYRPETLILETEFETGSGVVRLIDFMPPRGEAPDIIRIVEGVSGRVRVAMELIIRFDYGSIVPWVRKHHRDALIAVAGPDSLILRTPIETRGVGLTTTAEFTVRAGERVPFVLTWYPSSDPIPHEVDPEQALRETERFWQDWTRRCEYRGKWREAVVRSLITLKGLTFAPTGGIVAAPTTSLPEDIGGERNWDYRYCWIRDATFTLTALMEAGYSDEARAWREWLLRAVAGSPGQMQIMYGVRGERRLTELELPWLSGYENSKPVRIGNAASRQRQLDVYGELMDALYHAEAAGIEASEADWRLQRALMSWTEKEWHKPDEGIWEVRGGARQFTHSKMMAWVAFDRAVKSAERRGCSSAPEVKRWRRIRTRIHREVCARGYNKQKRAFTQYYDATELDASILMMPLVGFLPATDPRVVSTVDAVQRELMVDGLVRRYRAGKTKTDGLRGGEGAFLPCSFWLADCLHLIGRVDEANDLFEKLLGFRNDLGLLAEEYDPRAQRQLGNFPQAFSHVALVTTAQALQATEPGSGASLRS